MSRWGRLRGDAPKRKAVTLIFERQAGGHAAVHIIVRYCRYALKIRKASGRESYGGSRLGYGTIRLASLISSARGPLSDRGVEPLSPIDRADRAAIAA